MDHKEVGRLWDQNADAWTELSRLGYDTYRDWLNTPAFMDILPDIHGKLGLDIGCGEGHNTRQIAERGARIIAVDIAKRFVIHAKAVESEQSGKLTYSIASAVELPFAGEKFDFITAFMSLMDIPETDKVILEAYRVLKPGGFLQFSITHPCYDTPHRVNLRDNRGITYAIEVGDYFRNQDGKITEWLFSAAPEEAKSGLRPFRTPRFTRTISQWLSLLIDSGFKIEKVSEPRPSDDTVNQCPNIQDAQVVAYFLHIRVRK